MRGDGNECPPALEDPSVADEFVFTRGRACKLIRSLREQQEASSTCLSEGTEVISDRHEFPFIFKFSDPRRQEFVFTRSRPSKRIRALRELEGALAIMPSHDAGFEDEDPNQFQFSRPCPKRRVVRAPCVVLNTTSTQDGPASEPKPTVIATPPTYGQGSCISTAPAAMDEPAASTSGATPSAPIGIGFDMSKFMKPGQWKCTTCLVRNDAHLLLCESCETPRPGGIEDTVSMSGGDSSRTDGRSSGSCLLLGASTSTRPVFGLQPNKDTIVTDIMTSSTATGGFKFEAKSAAGPACASIASNAEGMGSGFIFRSPSNPASPVNLNLTSKATAIGTAPAAMDEPAASTSGATPSAPIGIGFDMSKFMKPGQWKCTTCLVRNDAHLLLCESCETPRPGGIEDTANMSGGDSSRTDGRAGGSCLLLGASTSTGLTFGGHSAAVSSHTGAASNAGSTAPESAMSAATNNTKLTDNQTSNNN